MTNRVVDAEVQAILDPTIAAVFADLTPFITAANQAVDRYLLSSYTEAELFEFERWWAAHNVSLASPQIKTERYDMAQTTYAIAELGKGLEGTMYGQMLLTLDNKGILETTMGKKSTISIF